MSSTNPENTTNFASSSSAGDSSALYNSNHANRNRPHASNTGTTGMTSTTSSAGAAGNSTHYSGRATIAAVPPVFEAQHRRHPVEAGSSRMPEHYQQMPQWMFQASPPPIAAIPSDGMHWAYSGFGVPNQRRRRGRPGGEVGSNNSANNNNNNNNNILNDGEYDDEIEFLSASNVTPHGVRGNGVPSLNRGPPGANQQQPNIMVPPPFGSNPELLLTASAPGSNGVLLEDEPSALVLWRERERRQRTIRMFMMFLLMLFLMEEEPNSSSVRHPNHPYNLRNSNGSGNGRSYVGKNARINLSAQTGQKPLSPDVYNSRLLQDERLRWLGRMHPRYHSLMAKQRQRNAPNTLHGQTTLAKTSITSNNNNDVDYNEIIVQWALSLSDMERDEFDSNAKIDLKGDTVNLKNGVISRRSNTRSTTSVTSTTSSDARNLNQHRSAAGMLLSISGGSHPFENEPHDDQKVLHYPWNSTGFYRGNWKRIDIKAALNSKLHVAVVPTQNIRKDSRVINNPSNSAALDTVRNTAEQDQTDDNVINVEQDDDDDNNHDGNGSTNDPGDDSLLKPPDARSDLKQQDKPDRTTISTLDHHRTNVDVARVLTRRLMQSQDRSLKDPTTYTMGSNNSSSLQFQSRSASRFAASAQLLLAKEKKSNTKTKKITDNRVQFPRPHGPLTTSTTATTNAVHMENIMLRMLQKGKMELFGVHVLPPGYVLETRDDNNLTTQRYEEVRFDQQNKRHEPENISVLGSTVPNTNNLRYMKSPDTNQILALNLGVRADGSKPGVKNILPPVTLTRENGRAAFQLFSRSIPAMKELSLVEGFIKLYDSTSPGYSTSKDLLLRVRGVLVHSIGRLSLTANANIGQAAFVMTPVADGNTLDRLLVKEQIVQTSPLTPKAASEPRHTRMLKDQQQLQRSRRLRAIMQNDPNTIDINQLRTDALEYVDYQTESLDASTYKNANTRYEWEFNTLNVEDTPTKGTTSASFADEWQEEHEILENHEISESEHKDFNEKSVNQHVSHSRKLQSHEPTSHFTSPSIDPYILHAQHESNSEKTIQNVTDAKKKYLPPWSDFVIPFPYVRDDDEESIRRTRTPAARLMPRRERDLEANAAHCFFEINMDIEPVMWTVGAWRKLVSRHVEETKWLDPNRVDRFDDADDTTNDRIGQGGRYRDHVQHDATHGQKRRNTDLFYVLPLNKHLEDQALVMSMIGEIRSTNCDFAAVLNVTALRTDWEATTNKAISYSFYMMLVCLTQILILLRQLLHSQSNTTATRVSILCVGWQTVIDALLCLAHIYLSLAVQPLFTAFASVAFFKLLIFCVIEMKYMAIITQARNSSSGGQPTDVLRRQVAILHLRFYAALIVVFAMILIMGDNYRTLFVLTLYSFWVPQIVLNIITEAKTPMHRYYIYGMSATRLVVPLYMLALPGNFLKQVYPDTPSDVYTCELLVLWIAFQTAILIGQSKYGARFMIPARFLPPKFDYSRPLPASMLPPGASAAILLYEQQARTNASTISTVDDSKPSVCSARSSTTSSPDEADTTSGVHNNRRHNTTAVTTRNRIRGRSRNNTNVGMITEDHTTDTSPGSSNIENCSTDSVSQTTTAIANSSSSSSPAVLPPPACCVMECSICYDGIDIRDRKEYMLAPCNHLFHRPCLSQWMDVKMECPICRTDLPAL